MKRTIVTILLLVLVSIYSEPQTKAAGQNPTSPKPAVPGSGTGAKVGVIDMQAVIAGSNEGQRDLGALAKKFEPRRAELQKLNTEIEDQKKQLSSQGDKMAPDAREALVKSIDTKTKNLQRSAEDFQNEFQQQQNEIGQRILQKIAPVISKYVSDNGYGVVLDVSAPWPRGPVVLASPRADITKAVVDAYNLQSGVPAPARSGGPTAPAKPSTPPTKP